MGRRKCTTVRFNGPYFHVTRKVWYVVRTYPRADGQGYSETSSFDTEDAARNWMNAEKENLAIIPDTLHEARDDYELYLKDKGNKSVSIERTILAIRRMFPEDRVLYSITPQDAQRIYDELRTTKNTKTGEPIANETHRVYLREVKSFFAWLDKKCWIDGNPFEKVDGIGKRNKGKKQMRFHEARKWSDHALSLAKNGDRQALGCLVIFYLGLRASELCALAVRDLDKDGHGETILWIGDDGKTDAAKRYLYVPLFLVPLLQEIADEYEAAKEKAALLVPMVKAKPVSDRMFDLNRHKILKKTWAICDAAEVPRVCAHSLRGLHATIAIEAGATSKLLAEALGHTSDRVTKEHYIDQGPAARAALQKGWRVISGGGQTNPELKLDEKLDGTDK